jgi:hypothetical protein
VLDDNPFTTSAFLVLIKLPGGRDVTRAYVNRLGAFNGPLFVKTPETARPEFPNYNPDIPQFPAGTEVALVRRALLVTAAFEVSSSPITESVQVRVYRQVPASTPAILKTAMMMGDEARSWQSFQEFLVSRRALFAGQSGGLRAVGRDKPDFQTGFSTHGIDMFEEAPELRPGFGSTGCVGCHFLPGVASFNTFAQHFTPNTAPSGRLAAMPVADVLASAVAWKQKQADWALLQRLLRASDAPRGLSSLIRGASPLGLPYTRPRSPLRRPTRSAAPESDRCGWRDARESAPRPWTRS